MEQALQWHEFVEKLRAPAPGLFSLYVLIMEPSCHTIKWKGSAVKGGDRLIYFQKEGGVVVRTKTKVSLHLFIGTLLLSSFGVVSQLNVPPAAAAEDFRDVSEEYWASDSIQRLSEQNIVNGYKDDTYRPGENMNRGQTAAMLANAFDLEVDPSAEAPFDDLTEESYFTPAAAAIKKEGLIKGRENNTQFAPAMELSREQMATIMVRAFDLEEIEGSGAGITDLEEANESHRNNIEILAQYDITSTEDGSFRPLESVTRAQFAVFLERALAVDYSLEQGITGVEAVDSTTVDVTFNQSVNSAVPGDFSFDPALNVVGAEVTESSNAESIVRLTTEKLEKAKDYHLYYKNSLTSGKIAGEENAAAAPVVEDVMGEGLKEVTITFSQNAADQEIISNLNAYTLQDRNGNVIPIERGSVEGDVVRLILVEPRAEQESAELKISEAVVEKEEIYHIAFYDEAAE